MPTKSPTLEDLATVSGRVEYLLQWLENRDFWSVEAQLARLGHGSDHARQNARAVLQGWIWQLDSLNRASANGRMSSDQSRRFAAIMSAASPNVERAADAGVRVSARLRAAASRPWA
jgi:hypothetical protein